MYQTRVYLALIVRLSQYLSLEQLFECGSVLTHLLIVDKSDYWGEQDYYWGEEECIFV